MTRSNRPGPAAGVPSQNPRTRPHDANRSAAPLSLLAAAMLLVIGWTGLTASGQERVNGLPTQPVDPAGGPRLPRVVRTSKDFHDAVARSKPGDQILVAPGRYRGQEFRNIRGTQKNPILIAAEDPTDPPVFVGGYDGLKFADVSHLELRSLVVEGPADNGVNIDDGGNMDMTAHHVVLNRLTIRCRSDNGNQDGIKLSGLTDFEVRGCRIEGWGRQGSAIDMVGCHNGLIVDCFIKGWQIESGNGIQVKGGSSNIVIRGCTLIDAGERAVQLGGRTERGFFRPRNQPFEAGKLTVERCVMIGSGSAVAFVGVDQALFRFNTIYQPRTWILRILQESGGPEFVPCRKVTFSDNLIVWDKSAERDPINIGPGTAPDTFVFDRNFWHRTDQPTAAASIPRLPTPDRRALAGADPRLTDPAGGNLQPGPDSPAAGFGAHAPEPEPRPTPEPSTPAAPDPAPAPDHPGN